MKEIVAEGLWCRTCEFLEEEDFDGDRCIGCGCHRNNHVEVEVIT